jgi:hypothetical protein
MLWASMRRDVILGRLISPNDGSPSRVIRLAGVSLLAILLRFYHLAMASTTCLQEPGKSAIDTFYFTVAGDSLVVGDASWQARH